MDCMTLVDILWERLYLNQNIEQINPYFLKAFEKFNGKVDEEIIILASQSLQGEQWMNPLRV